MSIKDNDAEDDFRKASHLEISMPSQLLRVLRFQTSNSDHHRRLLHCLRELLLAWMEMELWRASRRSEGGVPVNFERCRQEIECLIVVLSGWAGVTPFKSVEAERHALERAGIPSISASRLICGLTGTLGRPHGSHAHDFETLDVFPTGRAAWRDVLPKVCHCGKALHGPACRQRASHRLRRLRLLFCRLEGSTTHCLRCAARFRTAKLTFRKASDA